MPRFPINLGEHTEQELLELNKRIVNRVKELRRQKSSLNKQRLYSGQTVSWNNRFGSTSTGTIVKVKRTRAIVEVKNSFGSETTRWDIALNMLNPID